MRLFVTGATGFIGRAVCGVLQDHDLLILCRDPARAQVPDSGRALQGDLFQPAPWKEGVRTFRPDACLHLAWSDLPDYSLQTSTRNLNAGIELLSWLLELRCPRVVVTGTCLEYGNVQGCVDEGMAPGVQSLFGAFKSAQRQVGQSLFAASGGVFLWARPFFVYGPGQRPTSLIPSSFRALRVGERPAIRTPDAVQDFIHVEDVARGLAALLTSDAPSGIYNVGSGKPTRTRDAVNLVARLMGREQVFPPADRDGDGFWARIERIGKYTGWRPHLPLDEGLRQTLAAWSGS